MSQRALTLATKDYLQFWFGYTDAECDTSPDGQPPPMSGELFVAVHGGGFRNGADDSRQDYHTVMITITRRVPQAPFDRSYSSIIDDVDQGLEVTANQIIAKMHTGTGAYEVMNQANKYLVSWAGGRDVYGFEEPLRFRGCTEPQKKSGSWVHGDAGEPHAARTLTLTFSDALRQQSMAGQL